MFRVLMVLLAVATCTACSSRHHLGVHDDASLVKFNRDHAKRGGQLRLVDGRRLDADWIHVEADSTIWLPVLPGTTPHRVANDEVVQIVSSRSGRGALDGLIIGFVSGFAIGVASWGASDSYDTPPGPILAGLALGGVGALVGTPVGAGVKHDDKYTFQKPASGQRVSW